MINLFHMILDKILMNINNRFEKSFGSLWYKSVYTDVRKSQLGYKFHYNIYGKNEKRIKNLRVFLQTSKYQNTKYRDLLLRISFILLSLTKSKLFKSKVSNLINLIELSKISKYKFEGLIITSWLEGGVAEAVKIYSEKLSTDSKIAILRGLRHTHGSDLKPMVLEIVEKSVVIDRIPLIDPLRAVEQYHSKVVNIKKVYIHHVFEIELFVHTMLRTISTYFIMYIHDYYLFTTKFHLFDDNLKQINLEKAHQEFPNKLLDLQFIVDRVDMFVCPSENTYTKVLSHIPSKKLRWIYPPEEPNLEMIPVKKIEVKDYYKICIIGNMGIYKGSEVIMLLIKTIKEKNLHYVLYHFGQNPVMQDNDIYYNFPNLPRAKMLTEISSLNTDLAFLPFQAEETYSFALSDVLKLNLPLISTKVGAITERCMSRDLTILLDPSSDINTTLIALNDIIYGNSKNNSAPIPKYMIEARNRSELFVN